jgi:hypothetical protein
VLTLLVVSTSCGGAETSRANGGVDPSTLAAAFKAATPREFVLDATFSDQSALRILPDQRRSPPLATVSQRHRLEAEGFGLRMRVPIGTTVRVEKNPTSYLLL